MKILCPILISIYNRTMCILALVLYFLNSNPIYSQNSSPFFNKPTKDIPDAGDRVYISENEIVLDEDTLNCMFTKLKKVEISGVVLTIKKNHPNSIYERYNQKKDIKSFKLCAETIIIGSQFVLPQTNIEIYARNLIFEDNETDSSFISTSPVSINTTPTQFQNGKNGLRAGDINIWVNNFSSNNLFKRFILNGGKGQEAGLGKDGDPAKSLGTIKPDMVHKGNYFFYSAGCYIQDAAIAYSIVYTFGSFLGGSDRIQGLKEWPSDGNNALHGGKPGEGGKGGDFYSNLDLSYLVQNQGGTCGDKAPDYKGSEGGKPNPAYHLIQFKGIKTEKHIQYPGNNAISPSAVNSFGEAGNIHLINKKTLAWLHPRIIESIIRYSEDIYLSKYYSKTDSIVSDYLCNLKLLISKTESNKESIEYYELLTKLQKLKFQLSNSLDFYGNPFGWVPTLSFESIKNAFENEIEFSFEILYLTNWFNSSMDSAENKAKLLESTIDALKKSTDNYVKKYKDIVRYKIPKLQTELAIIEALQQLIYSQINIREQQLREVAINNIEERERREAERKSWQNIGTYLTYVPVGQPYIGVVGSVIKKTASEKDLDVSDYMKIVTESYSQSKQYSQDLTKFIDVWGQIDFSSIEEFKTSVDSNKQELIDASQELTKSIYNQLENIDNRKIAINDVEKELEKLKSGDSESIKLKEDITLLLNKKLAHNNFLTALSIEIIDILNNIDLNKKSMNTCAIEYGKVRKGFDKETKQLMIDIRRRAIQRLNYYHYQFSKAYEYRLLSPYNQDLLLNNLLTKLEEIAKSSGVISLDKNKDYYKSLISIYKEQLMDVTHYLIDGFNRSNLSNEKEFTRDVSLTINEIQRFNNGEPIVINLADREEFKNRKEINRRILNISVSDLKTTDNKGTIDFLFSHSGETRFISDSVYLIFRHIGFDGQNPIYWKSTCDNRLSRTPHVVDAKTSNNTVSLLFSFLGIKNEKIEIFSNPGLDAKIHIEAYTNNIRISELTLKVSYTFIQN